MQKIGAPSVSQLQYSRSPPSKQTPLVQKTAVAVNIRVMASSVVARCLIFGKFVT